MGLPYGGQQPAWEDSLEKDAVMFTNSSSDVVLKYKAVSHYTVDEKGEIQINGMDVVGGVISHVNFLEELKGVANNE